MRYHQRKSMVFFGKNLNALKYGAKHTFVMCQTQLPNNIYIDKNLVISIILKKPL